MLLGLLPPRMSFSPGQPSSHQPLTSSLPTSDPSLLHAPILFYREKEGNVWAPCLLLGVSSDGFNHPWVPSSSSPFPPPHLLSPPSPPSFQPLSHLHLPPSSLYLCFFLRDVAAAMLVFLSVPFVCESEWGSAPVERSEHYHTKSVGGPSFFFFFFFFFLEPSVCDGHEWAVWSVSFFLLVGCRSFDLNAFLHCLHCYLLQSFGLIMCQWCAVLNR